MLMNWIKATPLGEHSGCSYPACTSQEEILKAAAPGLIPQYEKDEQIQLLKDVEFTLKEFPALVESKVLSWNAEFAFSTISSTISPECSNRFKFKLMFTPTSNSLSVTT